jgi:hypothetical protein
VTILAELSLLSQAPKLGGVGIELRSLRRQSYIRMTDEQGRRGGGLLLEAARANALLCSQLDLVADPVE